MTERYNFADDFIAALNNPKRGFLMNDNVRHLSATKSRVAEMYKKMRGATRYVLDDDFLEFATMASMTASAQELLDQFKLMALPNDVVWVEWNEERRSLVQQKVADEWGWGYQSNSHINQHTGYLLEGAPHTPYDGEAFIGTPFCKWEEGTGATMAKKGEVFSSPMSIFFARYDEENNSGFHARYQKKFLADFYSISEGEVSEDMLKDGIDGEMKAFVALMGAGWIKRELTETDVFDVFAKHIRMIQGPAIDFFVDVKNQQWQASHPAKLFESGIKMTAGDARFLITVFSMLNYDWVVQEPREGESTRRYKHGKFYRGNSHIQLSIDLPKFNGVTITPKGFDSMNESTRRQHSVRGHWRRIRKTGKRIWVSSHLRGDPKLGVITKDYVLTHRR